MWMIVTVRCVSQSLAAEFAARGIDAGDCCEDEGKAYAIFRCLGGIAYAATFAIRISGSNYVEIPASIWGLALAPALVCFVIYWVRIAGAGRRLDADNRRPISVPGHKPSEAITTNPR